MTISKWNVLPVIFADADPIATDDSSKGIVKGQVWFNSTNNKFWKCNSAGVGAASWETINTVESAGNVGTGEGLIFKDITAKEIRFKTLKAGPNIVVTNNANDVTLQAVVTGGGAVDSLNGRTGVVVLDTRDTPAHEVVVSGTTLTLDASIHNGAMLKFTNIAGCTVTVPQNLPAKFACSFLLMEDASLDFVTSGGATLVNAQGLTSIAKQYSLASIYVESNSGGSSAVAVLVAGEGAGSASGVVGAAFGIMISPISTIVKV